MKLVVIKEIIRVDSYQVKKNEWQGKPGKWGKIVNLK